MLLDGDVPGSEVILGRPNNHAYDLYDGTSFTRVNAQAAAFAPNDFAVVSNSQFLLNDAPGQDLVIYESQGPEGADVRVEVSQDGLMWHELAQRVSMTPRYGRAKARTLNVMGFDLAESGLQTAEFIRVTSTGSSPDIDAIEFLHVTPRRLQGTEDQTRLRLLTNGNEVMYAQHLATGGDLLTVGFSTNDPMLFGSAPMIAFEILPIKEPKPISLSGQPALLYELTSTAADNTTHEGEFAVTIFEDQVFVVSWAVRADLEAKQGDMLKACLRSFTLEREAPEIQVAATADKQLEHLFNAWREAIKGHDYALYRRLLPKNEDTPARRREFVDLARRLSTPELKLLLGPVATEGTPATVECRVLGRDTTEKVVLSFEKTAHGYRLK